MRQSTLPKECWRASTAASTTSTTCSAGFSARTERALAIVREYRADEIPDILRVIRAAFAEYRGLLDPPSSAEHKTLAIVEQELARAAALVAEQDQRVVGCVFYRPHGEGVYLDRLAVLPEHRRQGIGRQLMAGVEQRAIEAGYGNVSLSVRLALTELQAYYRRQGYADAGYGSHAGYAHPTYVRLEKQL